MTCKFVSPHGNVEVGERDSKCIVNLDRVQVVAPITADGYSCVCFFFAMESLDGRSVVAWRYSTEEARDADLERVMSIAGCS